MSNSIGRSLLQSTVLKHQSQRNSSTCITGNTLFHSQATSHIRKSSPLALTYLLASDFRGRRLTVRKSRSQARRLVSGLVQAVLATDTTSEHGGWECMLNTMEACSIHAWPLVGDHFPFISCVEKLNYEEKYTEWDTCFKKLGLDPKPVIDCYTSGIGHKLELQYADEITALEPPHEYVPWIVVNGQPLYGDYPDFILFICKAYKGSKVPRACLGISHPIASPTLKSFNHVCYKEDEKSKTKSTLLEIISSTLGSWMIM